MSLNKKDLMIIKNYEKRLIAKVDKIFLNIIHKYCSQYLTKNAGIYNFSKKYKCQFYYRTFIKYKVIFNIIFVKMRVEDLND